MASPAVQSARDAARRFTFAISATSSASNPTRRWTSRTSRYRQTAFLNLHAPAVCAPRPQTSTSMTATNSAPRSSPSTVAQYLKRTKSAHKINVTFDYETESFVPVEDGEFVVINNGDPNIQPVVLPRSPRFATRRDFYEFYQDYYHCPQPDAGEVRILRPAAVNRAGNGWKLHATGLLEVIGEQPKKKPAEVVPEQPKAKPAPLPAVEPIVQKRIDQLRALDAKKQEQSMKTCGGCGASIESRYAFCWKCGNAMSSQSNGPVVVRSKPLPLPIDDDEMTVQHDSQEQRGGVSRNPMFSWTMSKPPDRDPSTSRGSVLKLMTIGGVAFLLLALGLFGLTRSDAPVEAAARPCGGRSAGSADPARERACFRDRLRAARCRHPRLLPPHARLTRGGRGRRPAHVRGCLQ